VQNSGFWVVSSESFYGVSIAVNCNVVSRFNPAVTDAKHTICTDVVKTTGPVFLLSWWSQCQQVCDCIMEISGCGGVVVEYRTRNREVAGSTRTRSTASNFEQVANLLCAQANSLNSASYPQRDGK